jgi:hypothetical protein
VVATPLTALLKREAFKWLDEAEEAFQLLKRTMMTTALLQMSDFDKWFIINCNASGTGFVVMLHQRDGVIAYFGQRVAPHHQKLPAYEHELIDLVKVVHHLAIIHMGSGVHRLHQPLQPGVPTRPTLVHHPTTHHGEQIVGV